MAAGIEDMERLMTTHRNHHHTWDERDLIRRLCHALDIADLAIEHLAPAGFTDPQRPSASVRAEKVIAETAVLLHGATLATHHPEVSALVHRVAQRLAPYSRSPQMKLGLALNPSLAFDYSLGHILLSRLGYPDIGFDKLLNQCRASQAHAGRERLPHRALEQEWIAGLRHETTPATPRNVYRTARRTILATPMDLFSSTDEDLYAFTHAIMYVTGFGLNRAVLPRRRSIILAEAEAVLARCLDAQDYDLAGEILLAWPLTGKSWSATATFAFHVLADVEDKAGFLPTPATRVNELKARQGSERTRYLLATAYHTAYVMGLLCAAALQPGCAPPASVPPRSRGVVCARRILAFIDATGSTPHWRETFEGLHPEQAESLAGLLFNIALQRNAAQRDFSGIETVLRLAYDFDLAAVPAASQAAEMLQSAAAYASSLSGREVVNHLSESIVTNASPRVIPSMLSRASHAVPAACPSAS